MSDYSLECSLETLMNLSMRTSGKDKLVEKGKEVIALFKKLLKINNNSIRSFINGTLFSALCREELIEICEAQKLKETLLDLRA